MTTLKHDDPERAFLSRQLSVVREMLTTLETLTIPGRHYVMQKVVGFAQDQATRASSRVSRRNRQALADSIELLKRESSRPLPDSVGFSEHADSLIALLASV
jgi:hypothetical protein